MKKLLLVLTVVSMAALLFVGCLPSTNNAPVITSSPVTTGTIGTAYTYTVTATDADAGDTLTYAVTGPTGMVISSAGVISGWTPAAAGTYAVSVVVSDGTDSVTQSFNVTVPSIGPAEITIEVAGEYPDTATGKTYVKCGSREITVTFPAAVENPVVEVGTVVVPVFTLDNKVFKGTGMFVGPCDAVLITVSGVCEDLCAAKSVVVDSGKPYAELKATVAACECATGYALTVTSDWSDTTDCCSVPGCCGDDCSGLASWNVKIYHEYPWDDCCEEDPCIEPNAEADGTACPISVTKECIDEVFTPEGWVDFFDYHFWVIVTLTDKVGNEIKYYGEVITDPVSDTLVSFVELYIDPTSLDCVCYAEDPAAADLVIGDCDGTPADACWEEPLEPCPEITVVPTEPVEGQPATVTIDYTLAVKPTGVVAAYVGPAFKILPLGVPEGSSALPLEKVSAYVYEANVVFGEAGDRIIYVVDACEDCPPCTENITVLPADVCPVVEFLLPTFYQGDVPGYGLTNIDFTVTFANPVEKELVDVYVGIPGLAPLTMPFEMTPLSLEVPMVTTDEVTYNGRIPLGDLKVYIINWLNHYFETDPYEEGWIDPEEPWAEIPELELAMHALGCIPLEIYVLAGDPCCIQTCEYPFIVDPIGPYASLEVTVETCDFEPDPCIDPGACEPCSYPGHKIVVSTLEPDTCDEIGCCGDTCSGVASWTAYICACDNDPFDECCLFDAADCENTDCVELGSPWSGTSCDVEFETECINDYAYPFEAEPFAEVWSSTWYLYVKMVDNAGNVTEYKASMTFDTGSWVPTIVPLCEDAEDDTFGSIVCEPEDQE